MLVCWRTLKPIFGQCLSYFITFDERFLKPGLQLANSPKKSEIEIKHSYMETNCIYMSIKNKEPKESVYFIFQHQSSCLMLDLGVGISALNRDYNMDNIKINVEVSVFSPKKQVEY